MELLESRSLLTATPTIEIARDPSSPGFTFDFAGSADPFATVQVSQAGGAVVGETTANATGHWQLTHSGAQLADGEFRFQAIAADAQGEISQASTDAVYRPNFVLMNVDDMAAHDLPYMPLVNQLLAGSGTTFANSFVPTGLSGPSRAALLTGQYAHSNGVFENFAPLGGALNLDATSTFATWLHDAGYRTARFGKNETARDNVESSDPAAPPPGWDEISTYDGELGGLVNYKDGVRTSIPYQFDIDATAIWDDLSQNFVRENDGASSPFLLYVAPIISHRPYSPRPEFAGTMNGVPDWRPPSYNVPPPYLTGVFPKPNIDNWDMQRRRHLEALQSIDQAVGDIYQSLVETGELDNTVFVLTADNGLMWGEHAQFSNKDNFFEESLRVPLVIRDGRMPLTQLVSQNALNIDIAPTFARLAGVSTPPIDGLDLSAVVHGGDAALHTSFVIEHQWNEEYDLPYFGYGRGGVGLHTDQWKYVEYESGLHELFDLVGDPFELQNLASDPQYAAVQQSLATQLHDMLPEDDVGPVVTSISQQVEFNDAGLPLLRIEGVATDDDTGGSEIRSPEYYIDELGTNGWGQPLDQADGGFDSSSEPFRGMIPASRLASLAPGSHVLYVRARDVVGNWGAAVSVPFNLLAGPQLDPGSDTGASNSDGMTLNSTPTIRGMATPEAVISLFAVGMDQVSTPAGSAIADEQGQWETTASLAAGVQSIFAVIRDPASSAMTFSAGLPMHLAAIVEGGSVLHIVGSNENDEITADATVAGTVAIVVNGVSAGSLPWSGPVQIDGLAGDDRLIMLGALPARLIGGEGDDVLHGGAGPDWLEGDTGINELIGEAGDDTYRFTASEDFGSTDTISEQANQGYDTLDFSQVPIPLSLTWGPTTLAHYTARGHYDRVLTAAGSKLSYERVIGSPTSDTIAVPASIALDAGKGNDLVSLQSRINSGQQLPLPTLVGQDGNEPVRAVFTVTQGQLLVSIQVPGGVSASQIVGNGTNHVEIVAPASQLRQTWNAVNGLMYLAGLVAPGTTTITVSIYSLSDGAVLERDSAALIVNAPPVLALSGSGSYAEQAAPVLIALSATVQDAEGRFSGGQLVVAVTANIDADDRLSIQNQGNGSGQIGVAGNQVSMGGKPLGTFTGGAGSNPLVISFTSSSASPAAVQRLVRAITFANVGDAPATGPHTIAFTLIDGDGGASQAMGVQVNVTAINDAPVLTGSAALGWSTFSGSPNPTEVLVSTLLANYSDPDGNPPKGVAVTVASEFSGRWQYTLNGVTWVSCGAPTSQAALLLPAAARMRYVPDAGFRGEVRLRFLAWDRTQGTAGATADVSTTSKTGGSTAFSRLSATAVVTVLPPTENPVLAFSGAVGYVHDRPPIVLTPYATVSDADSLDFDRGQLRVRITQGAGSSNRLAIGGEFTFDEDNNVLLGGVTIGRRITSGFGINDLVVTFNSAAKPSVVQQLVRAITFKTVGGTPGKRSVLFSVTDGDGGSSKEIAKPVNVT